ncbi:MAG TPA: hypothetical protein DC064_09385 [Cyanobacteria bacterium UBA9273]|nr:hypothetical protein [Cyanobacteria bacterium UBA9273]
MLDDRKIEGTGTCNSVAKLDTEAIAFPAKRAVQFCLILPQLLFIGFELFKADVGWMGVMNHHSPLSGAAKVICRCTTSPLCRLV